MKKLVILIAALAVVIPACSQTLTGRSNSVRLEISSKPKSSPPVLVWISPDQTSSVITANEVTIKVGVNSTYTLKNVTVLINGQSAASRGFGVSSPEASKFTKFVEQKIPVSAGYNEIKIIAENDKGE